MCCLKWLIIDCIVYIVIIVFRTLSLSFFSSWTFQGHISSCSPMLLSLESIFLPGSWHKHVVILVHLANDGVFFLLILRLIDHTLHTKKLGLDTLPFWTDLIFQVLPRLWKLLKNLMQKSTASVSCIFGWNLQNPRWNVHGCYCARHHYDPIGAPVPW